MGASPKRQNQRRREYEISFDAVDEMKRRISAKNSFRNSLGHVFRNILCFSTIRVTFDEHVTDRREKIRLAILFSMSLILCFAVYGMAVFKSTYQVAENTTIAPTAAPLTTTRKS